jgi:hypothetical protein
MENQPATDPETTTSQQPNQSFATESIFHLLNMAWIGQAVFVATKLGIADQISAAPKSIADLAQSAGVDESHLRQLMRALAGFGIFSVDENEQCRLTPLAEPLAATGFASSWLRNYVILWGEQLYPAGGQLLEMFKSGRVAFDIAHGHPLYTLYNSPTEDENPSKEGLVFRNFMSSVTAAQTAAIVSAVDFQPYRHVVDVGGGRADLITAILRLNKHLKGTIIDQPNLADFVSERIRRANLTDRCDFVGGDFFKEVPSGGDLYMIKHVLHDWPDRDVARILANISSAMPDDATLIIIEGILDERDCIDPLLKTRDLEQMLWCGGKVRSRTEWELLLQNAGLQLASVQSTPVPDGVLLTARHKAS